MRFGIDRGRFEIDRAWHSDGVAVSAISFWEVAMLKEKGRLRFPEDVGMWRREQLDQGIAEVPVDGDIGIRTAELTDFHGDPADRIIVATALGGHRLVTADRRILESSGAVNRLRATVWSDPTDGGSRVPTCSMRLTKSDPGWEGGQRLRG